MFGFATFVPQQFAHRRGSKLISAHISGSFGLLPSQSESSLLVIEAQPLVRCPSALETPGSPMSKNDQAASFLPGRAGRPSLLEMGAYETKGPLG